MHSQFQRILDLVKKTKDRLVVTDPDGHNAYVIMDLASYEDLMFGGFGEDDDDWDDGFDEIDPLPELGPEDKGGSAAPVPAPAVDRKEELPEDIRKAVEHDLAILDTWRKEEQLKEQEKERIVEQKPAKPETQNGPDEERFYLEPIE